MNFQAYVINLEHATTRWAHVKNNLTELDIPYTRVEGVYGDHLAKPIEGYNEKKYHILNGKVTNKREVGCYFSHIKALKIFLKTEQPYALILEDDVTLPADIKTIIAEAITYNEDWDLLRLTSSRQGEYLTLGTLSTGHNISYNIRVLKNTGAYLISRHGAECCINKLLPMVIPYDEALDRDWAFGFKTACITPFPVQLEEEMPSQIPRAERIRFYRSTTFHLFHILTHFQRIHHRKKYFKKLKTHSMS